MRQWFESHLAVISWNRTTSTTYHDRVSMLKFGHGGSLWIYENIFVLYKFKLISYQIFIFYDYGVSVIATIYALHALDFLQLFS